MATVKTAGGLIPGTVDTPLDARSRVSAEAEIMNIENPVLGALVFCSGNCKYYKITAQGREAYRQAREEWQNTVRILNALLEEEA